jgi:hypothetical protein
MSELRVPTLALAAEVLCADGQTLIGRIFVPATASRHDGPMRPEEWLNDPAPFFPFLPDDTQVPLILNKREILAVSVAADTDVSASPDSAESPTRRVALELEGRRIEGTLVIDMPETQRRVQDYLNRPEPFVTVRDGDRHHLVQKERIARVIEIREG